MGETLPLFTTSFNRSLSVESRAEHLSGDGGAIVQRELMERSGIISVITHPPPLRLGGQGSVDCAVW